MSNLIKLDERFKDLLVNLSSEQKKYIHYKSFENFFKNVSSVKNEFNKNKIYNLLEEYISLLEENSNNIDRDFSNHLAFTYLFTIGDMLKEEIYFVQISKIGHAIFYCVIIDLL